MSLEISPTKFEIRSDIDNGLVLDHATKLIPIIHKMTVSNVMITYPNPNKQRYDLMRTGNQSSSPNGKAWRSYAWCLQIFASTESGQVTVGSVPANLPLPNFMLANVNVLRTASPTSVFGSFEKVVLENVWMPLRSGLRMEYQAWMRRIAWLELSGRDVILKWKQSSRAYQPNALDPNNVFFPDRYYDVESPPGYKFAHEIRYNNGGVTDPIVQSPPNPYSPPSSVQTAINNLNFTSTWRFNFDIALLRL